MSEFMRSTKGRIITIVTVVVVIVAAIVGTLLIAGWETGYRNIFISKIFGSVMAENNGNEYEAYENMRLASGYSLTTGTDSYTRLSLDDDKYVKLEQESRAVFTNVGNANKHITAISLESGAMTAELVNPLTEQESFVVNTPNAVLAVRGTFFRVEVTYDEEGRAFTNVYVYSGVVVCKRILPDGTAVDEEVTVNKGYKACIKMDEIITVYIEELAQYDFGDYVDPINIDEVCDADVVDTYNASYHGHAMFMETSELWQVILDRGINLDDYYSAYDFGKVPPYTEDGESTVNNVPSTTETAQVTDDETNTSETSDSETTDTAADLTEPETGAESSTASLDSTTIPPTTADASVGGAWDTDVTENTEPDSSASVSATVPQYTSATAETTSESTAAMTVPEVTSAPEETTAEITAPETSTEETAAETTAPETVTETEETEHEHVWGEYVYNNDATCTKDGTKTAKCSGCDEENTVLDEGSALGHGFDDYVSNNDATCTKDGTKTAQCIRCGKEDTIIDEGSALGHEFGDYVSNNDAACAEDGTKTAQCTRCDREDTIVDEGSALGHEFGDYVSNNDETCTEDGTKTAQCTRCDGEDTVIDEDTALGHIEVEEIIEPTLAKEGKIIISCSRCEELLSEEVLDKLDSLYAEDGSIVITETGYTQGEDGEEIAYTGDYVITQGDPDVSVDNFYLTIKSGTHNITIDGWNIQDNSGNSIFNVYTEASVTLTCRNNNTITSGNTDYAIYNSGKLTINGGSIEIKGAQTGISNHAVFTIAGGSVTTGTISATGYPITVTGGSLKLTEEPSANMIVNANGDELTCTVYDSYPGNILVSLLEVEYTYALSSRDAAADGKYYVWLPVELKFAEIDEVNFPDKIFRRYVIENFDSNKDGYLSKVECRRVTEVDVQNSEVASLKGIEYFINLEKLICNSCRELTSLDLSENTALIYLYCTDSGITSLDVSKNTALETLNCTYTEITELDVSKNTALKSLSCTNTGITELDVGENTALNYLECINTGITSLDVSNNKALTYLYCSNTEITSLDVSENIELKYLYCDSCNLTYMDVSNNLSLITFSAVKNTYTISYDTAFSTDELPGSFDPAKVSDINGADFNDGVFSKFTGAEVTYTYDCGNEKSVVFTLLIEDFPEGYIEINEENFPDEIFRTYVSENFDLDENGRLSETECEAVASINVSGSPSTDGGVTSLEGIEYFTKLSVLSCYYNKDLTAIDVSNNTELMLLSCYDTGITELDLSNNTALIFLECFRTEITSLVLSNCNALDTLYCYNTEITSLDLSNNTALEALYCYNTGITELDLSNNTALIALYCYNTEITSLDVSNNTELLYLGCRNTGITSLDLSNNTKLLELYCYDTGITSLDLSNNDVLTYLQCSNCNLAYVDVSNNPSLSTFNAVGNTYTIPYVTTFDTADLPEGFDKTKVSDVENADYVDGVFINITGDISYTYDCGNGHSETFTLVREDVPEGYISISASFPDDVFRSYVSEKFDIDKDGYLSEGECNAVRSIGVGGTSSADGGITSLEGIEYFPNLSTLFCYFNTGLTAIDVSNNTALLDLHCYNTGITELDVSKNTALEYLWCYRTGITELDVSKNTALESLNCYQTGITELDVSNNTALTFLNCQITAITSLDVSKNTALESLWCTNTGITSLDLSNNTALTTLYCYDTELTYLNVSNTALETLDCRTSHLAYVDVSNISSLSTFNAGGNTYQIPADADEFNAKEAFHNDFDPDNVSNVTNADYADGVFTNITGNVTYTYACSDDYSVTFTLKRTSD